MRYVVEGTWTGYTSSQYRVVHREVITERRAEKLKSLHSIVYTDGTRLLIEIHPIKPRERVKEIRSYDSLIREAEVSGKSVFTVLGADNEQ